MELSFRKIKKVLQGDGNRLTIVFGYVGLLVGMLLLLLCLQLFFDIQKALNINSGSNGFDYISLSKSITNENMGSANNFSASDIDQLKQLPEVEDISALQTNEYYVHVSAGSTIPFSTDLFLESVNESFLDTLPLDFKWQEGQTTVPVIFSSDFLEMYNVFAPAQGLPQISPQTLKAVNLNLECAGPRGRAVFKANVVALSDRVQSILVPLNFMNWSNQHFAGVTSPAPSRVYLKVRDANDPRLISWLQNHGYHLNEERFKYGKLKGVLQNVVAGLTVLGILVLLLAMILFSFVIKLNISKSRDNLVLLYTLGYNKKWLSDSLAKTWLPVYLTILILALVSVQLLHIAFVNLIGNIKLDILLHWSVFACAALFPIILFWLINSLIKRELSRIL